MVGAFIMPKYIFTFQYGATAMGGVTPLFFNTLKFTFQYGATAILP